MHEFGIATSLLDAARAETSLRPGAKLAKIAVRVGDVAGVDAEALRFCFEALVKDTEWDSVILEIERRAQWRGCPQCGMKFEVIRQESRCPACRETMTTLLSGDELELAYLEMEDL